MKAKEIIKLNNEKRELLNEENLKDYENMLVYIRLSSTKSEQKTEEILLELLDHALLAQEEGKTIKDIFGDNLKAFAQEVIEEIPRETKKKQFKFAFRLIFIFFAVSSFFYGLIHLILHYIFDFGERTSTFHLGSSIAIIMINSIIALGSIIFILEWVKSSTFKEENKSAIVEFIQLWFIMMIIISLLICVIYFMPTFGVTFSFPTVIFIPIGLVLYGISYVLKD